MAAPSDIQLLLLQNYWLRSVMAPSQQDSFQATTEGPNASSGSAAWGGAARAPSAHRPAGRRCLFLLTRAKWDVRKLLSGCRVILEIPVRLEVQGILPGVPQSVVNGGRDTHLMAGGNTVPRNSLQEKRQDPTNHKISPFFFLKC